MQDTMSSKILICLTLWRILALKSSTPDLAFKALVFTLKSQRMCICVLHQDWTRNADAFWRWTPAFAFWLLCLNGSPPWSCISCRAAKSAGGEHDGPQDDASQVIISSAIIPKSDIPSSSKISDQDEQILSPVSISLPFQTVELAQSAGKHAWVLANLSYTVPIYIVISDLKNIWMLESLIANACCQHQKGLCQLA